MNVTQNSFKYFWIMGYLPNQIQHKKLEDSENRLDTR